MLLIQNKIDLLCQLPRGKTDYEILSDMEFKNLKAK